VSPLTDLRQGVMTLKLILAANASSAGRTAVDIV
jgi:hypothetical protein